MAIGMVVLCHAIELLPSSTLGILVYWWTGFLGVELFYVLSGYLIGSILLEICQRHRGKISFRKHLPDFLIRRWFRTLPNYYLFLLLDILINTYPPQLIPRYLVFCQNLAWPMASIMSVSWSLAIEEWFYLTFPVLLIVLLKWLGKPERALAMAGGCYLAFFFILRGLASEPGLEMRKVVVLRLDAIAFGALMMLVMRLWPETVRKARYLLAAAGLAGTGFVLWWLTQLVYGAPPIWGAALYSLTGVSLACWLPLAVFQTEGAGASKLRTAIATVSIISYSIYLLHTSIALHLVYTWMRGSHWSLQCAVYLTLCLVLSILTYNLYEKPMTALRDRFSAKTAVEL